MNEKKSINLSTILLLFSIIIIVVLLLCIYKLNLEKTNEIQKTYALQEQVSDLQNRMTIISETINSSNVKNNNLSNLTEINEDEDETENLENENSDEIILNGSYSIPNSDTFYDFTSDGKAACSGSVNVNIGTYKAIDKNTIEIKYTKKISFDDDTGAQKTSSINLTDTIKIDKNDIVLIDSNGKEYKLVKDGEVHKEYFE